MATNPQLAAGTTPPCHACEALLPDALDHILSPADQAWFDTHLAACSVCSDMMADAQRGAAWLELLKAPRPEPSPALMNRILAQTSGQNHVTYLVTTLGTLPGSRLAPETWVGPPQISIPTNVLPFRPRLFSPMARMLETRLAMTAAMAFFSIAVTLSLTGVHLNQIHASDLRPGNLRNTWFQTTAQAHRSYDNLRVVRLLASRVESVRDNLRAAPDNSPNPEPQPTPPKPDGSSRRETPADRTRLLTRLNPNEIRPKQGGLA